MMLDPFDITQLSFAVVVSIVLILFIRRNGDRRKALFSKISGPFRVPILGTALEFFNVPNEGYYPLQFKLRDKFGDRYITYTCGFYYIVLSNPDDIEKLLTSSVHITKGQTYSMVTPWLGDGLLTSTGAKWQTRRKLLTPSFHFRILEDFLTTFNEQAEILIDILRTDFKNKQEKDICQYITRCTLDIIADTAMGKKLNAQRDIDSAYVKAVNKACVIQAYRGTRPLLWPDFIFYLTSSGREYNSALKTLHAFTDNVIREIKASRNNSHEEKPLSDSDELYWHGKKRRAFLDLLLDAQENSEEIKLSDLDIREEVDTFMFEGHDTTSASLSWTTFLLACNPECQAKVHQELDGIFDADKTRPITSKDVAEMKYLEMCIKEALRIFPSVPFISRSITSDFILDDDVTIPAGCDIILLTMPIHRNESIFPDPLAFQPDRFLPENTVSRHPFSYIPFSAGPRNCIGQKFALMEEKVILGNIFRNFIIEPAEPLEDVVVMMEVVTRPRDGLKIRLLPR